MFFTVPTLLTWTRIVAIPLLVGVFYLGLEPRVQNLIATTMFIAFVICLVFFTPTILFLMSLSDAIYDSLHDPRL